MESPHLFTKESKIIFENRRTFFAARIHKKYILKKSPHLFWAARIHRQEFFFSKTEYVSNTEYFICSEAAYVWRALANIGK